MLAKSSVLLALAAAATAAPAPASPQLAARDTSDKPATLPESHWKEARLTTDGFNSDKWINGFEKAKAVVAGLTFEQKVRQPPFQRPSLARNRADPPVTMHR